MKKYRLKEEVKKYLNLSDLPKEPKEEQEWLQVYSIKKEALEEVEQRIELYSRPRCEGMLDNGHTKIIVGLQKVSGEIFTDQEKELCEKALNGELLDIDSLDDDEFADWYRSDCYLEILDCIKAVLKQYLKEKK